MKNYDFIIIGGGSGGVRAARMAGALAKQMPKKAGKNAKIALIEKEYLGGTCVNVGCIPKKLYGYAAEIYKSIDLLENYGFEGIATLKKEQPLNWSALQKNKDLEIKRLNGIYKRLLENQNIDIYHGHASFKDNHHISVSSKEDKINLKADKFLVATGCVANKPKHSSWIEHAISSKELFALEKLPKTMAIVGGGYIAVEFASILATLGVKVHLIYHGPTLLKKFDHAIANHFMDELRKNKNLNLLLNTSISEVRVDGKNKVLTLNGEHKEALKVECLLGAIGRKPNTHDLGLENTLIKTTKYGAIIVEDSQAPGIRFRTHEPHIYAVGDVINRAQLTPVALSEGMVVAYDLYGDASKNEPRYDCIPTAVFSVPQIATVGLTQKEAEDKSYDIGIYQSSFRSLKHTMHPIKTDEVKAAQPQTLMKMIVDKQTDKVLGMHMVGDNAGEIIQGFAVAVQAGVTKSEFDITLGIHPSTAEEFVTMRTPLSI